RRDDFGLKIGKLSHRTSIKDGLGRHIGSCGPLNRNFPKFMLNMIPVKIHYLLPGVFEGNVYKGAVNGSLWTIPYEVLCYFMVALLGLTKKIKLKYSIMIFFTTLILSSLHLSLAFNFIKYFSAGMIFFLLKDKIIYNNKMALISLILLFISAQTIQLNSLMPIFGGYLIFYVSFSKKINLHNFGKYGDLSYGMYVYAFPIQQTVVHLHGGSMNPIENFLITTPITIAIAYLSWKFIESPALSLKDKRFISLKKTT
ncbi:acyltransferase family protein, partial [Klebsiella variicola]